MRFSRTFFLKFPLDATFLDSVSVSEKSSVSSILCYLIMKRSRQSSDTSATCHKIKASPKHISPTKRFHYNLRSITRKALSSASKSIKRQVTKKIEKKSRKESKNFFFSSILSTHSTSASTVSNISDDSYHTEEPHKSQATPNNMMQARIYKPCKIETPLKFKTYPRTIKILTPIQEDPPSEFLRLRSPMPVKDDNYLLNKQHPPTTQSTKNINEKMFLPPSAIYASMLYNNVAEGRDLSRIRDAPQFGLENTKASQIEPVENKPENILSKDSDSTGLQSCHSTSGSTFYKKLPKKFRIKNRL